AILGSIGSVYIGLGNNAQSLTYSRQSLAAFEALGQKVEAARALNQIGIAHHNSGNFTEALEHYQKSLVIRQEVGDKAKIAETVRNIGNIHTVQGRYDEALEYYQQSLTFIAASGDDSGLASALNNIGVVYENQGNLAEAMALYRKSLTIRERLGNKLRIAIALNNIGSIYRMQGNYQQALDYLQRSLGIRQSLGDKFGISSSLNNIGAIYREEGDSTLALKHFQQNLAVAGEMGNKGLIAILLNEIGNISYNTNDYLKASECYEKSLAISEASGIKVETAKSLNGIARVSYAEGKHRQASESAERAATIARQINTRHQLSAALTIAGMAYRAIGQPDRARAAFAEAINVVEFLRSNVGGQESRTSYFATAQQPYELYIDLLMQLHKQRPSEGHDALALQTNERARARSLLEALSEARADIRQGVDTELLRHERGLQQRLNATAERHVRLLSGKHTEEQAATVKKEIDALTAEFQDVQAQIRQKSPRYAALTQPAPLTLREIQTDVLDADTLLLEYALGEERSYLWAVTPTSITSYELPKRAEIDTAARRVYELLSDHKLWTTTGDAAGAQYAAAAARLSQMVLAPAVAQIQGKRLVIVADGGLQYVPFGALPKPQWSVSSGQWSEKSKNRPLTTDHRPLISEHEIISLPSASTLSVLRRETANRQPAPKSVAVLADPVFEKTDERVATAIAARVGGARSGATEPASNRAENSDFQSANSRLLLERAFGQQPAIGEVGGTMREALRIPRLPFTRREAEAILAVTPTREGMKALDFRASRQTAISPGLAQHRIVHFATHGLLNSEHPELSGVVLSLVDEHGKPVDGFLRLHEIYNLNLPAEMVVLSACQTALGKEIKGEGLVGLTRGFMYAGAPRVVASLWKVNDVATAELMKRFYSGMLKENLRPAAALRVAKVAMWKQKRWHSPYYWVAFELQGEWK
ncbi:MAG: CHAT domain-containing protein, partial [Acidobacteriota bacterium]|nr:CHAT domain-containing protein [Acidobacteriota bacterium]